MNIVEQLNRKQREYTLSQSTFYLFGSFLFFQLAQLQPQLTIQCPIADVTAVIPSYKVYIVISGLFIVLALFLGIAAYRWRPPAIKVANFLTGHHFRLASLIVLMFAWVLALIDILSVEPSSKYFYIFFFVGLTIMILYAAYPLYTRWRERCKPSQATQPK